MKALVIVLVLSGQVRTEQPVDCATVRSKVREHGKVVAYAWALANGISPKEISRIRKQCGV